MTNGPVRKSDGGGTLFELPVKPSTLPCEGPGCGKPVPQPTGKGRAKLTCSISCKSRRARALAARRTADLAVQASAATAPAAPGGEEPQSGVAAGAASGAGPLAETPSGERRRLLDLAHQVDVRSRHFLQDLVAADGDPDAALEEFLTSTRSLLEGLHAEARTLHATATAVPADRSDDSAPGSVEPERPRPAAVPDRSDGPASGSVESERPRPAAAVPADRSGNPAAPVGGRLRGLVEQRLAQQQAQPRTAAPTAGLRPGPVGGVGEEMLLVPRHPHSRGYPSITVTVRELGPHAKWGHWWRLEGWPEHPDLWLVTDDDP
ncbi:hypothetical protein ACWEO1_40075 [Kitasatospora cineracea]